MCGIDWMAEEPVPITATRWPLKSTPSRGQRPVCQLGPSNVSAPGKAGSFMTERQPVAMMQWRAVIVWPRSVVTAQRLEASSKWALVTRVSS